MNTAQKALVLAILAVAALHFVGWSDQRVRNCEIMPDMVASVPYGSLDANPNFADGKTAQAPVEGTIARGFPPLHGSGLLLETAGEWKDLGAAQQRAWDAYAMPAEAEGDLARGRAVFQAICSTCHGAGGGGDGKATKRGVPPPPALDAEGAVALSDGRIFRIITAGQGNMAPHAAQVARADRWRVVRYIRSLQK